MTPYKIAINSMATGKLPQGDPRWATFNDSFVNGESDLIDIANAIYMGRSYAAWHRGRRSLENFILAQHIAVDMDSGDARSSFDVLARHDLVQMYAGLMHTTPSHTPTAPRARVIFLLDEPITDAAGFQAAAKFLVAQFDGADLACTDASRFFYGASKCDIWLSENVLPVRQLRRHYRKWGGATQVPTQAPTYADNVIPMDRYRQQRTGGVNVDALLEPVRMAREGSRNHTLNRQAFLAGKDIRAGKLHESEIVPLLVAAATSAGLTEQEAMRTINSGLRGGGKAVGE